MFIVATHRLSQLITDVKIHIKGNIKPPRIRVTNELHHSSLFLLIDYYVTCCARENEMSGKLCDSCAAALIIRMARRELLGLEVS